MTTFALHLSRRARFLTCAFAALSAMPSMLMADSVSVTGANGTSSSTNGGDAVATATGSNNENASATGGNGGSSYDGYSAFGGNGGAGIASATATATDSSGAIAIAQSIGGDGGSGGGHAGSAGDGGDGSSAASATSAYGGAVDVYSLSTGGNAGGITGNTPGGSSIGVAPEISLDNTVSGSSNGGTVTLTQDANGGNGSYNQEGDAGNGAVAASNVSTTVGHNETAFSVTCNATAGSGGTGDALGNYPAAGGQGGDAGTGVSLTSSSLSTLYGSSSATAGAAGTSTQATLSKAGDATSNLSLSTNGGGNVTGIASAIGGNGGQELGYSEEGEGYVPTYADGGAGGFAKSTATVGTSSGNSDATASAIGGNGGQALNSSGTSGLGGGAAATATAISMSNGNASATAHAIGGSGGTPGTSSANAIAIAGFVETATTAYGVGSQTATAYASPTLTSGSINGTTVTVGMPPSGSSAAASGTFTQSGSSIVSATESLTVDQGSIYVFNGNNPSGNDAGGIITTPLENIGGTSNSISYFEQSGGTNTTAVLNASDATNVKGNVILSGGALNAMTFNVGSPDGVQGGSTIASTGAGAVAIFGGTLSVGTLRLVPNGYFLVLGGVVQATLGISQNISTDSGDLTVSGGSLAASMFSANNNSLIIVNGGIMNVSGTLTNASSSTFEYDGGSLTANVNNFGTFNVRGGGTETLTGDFTNESGATLKTYGTTFAVTGTFTNNGTYSSDPANNHFSTLTIGPTGTLLGGVGDKYIVASSLISSSTNNHGWNTEQATLSFDGYDSHTFDVNGTNEGAVWSGYQSNYSWGVLNVGHDQSLSLVNASGTTEGGLYVGTLDLADGLSQLADIKAQGVDVFYDAALNAWLGGGTYGLSGGGELLPITGDGETTAFALQASVPEPGTLAATSIFFASLLSSTPPLSKPAIN